jgi:Skp family chaperone for outer membrane proteins
MRTILLAAGTALAVLSAAVSAQGDAPAAVPPPACYIEVQRLMAEPPAGIAELGAALRELDAKLRPQVEEINALKAQIARLEQREAQATPAAGGEAALDEAGEEAPRAVPAAPGPDPTAEEIREIQTRIEARQAQLKLDYAAQQEALVGPVQARISRGAQAFASSQKGCAEVKMARAPDLAALTSSGARNVTGEFVAWYLANPPA